MRADMTTAEGSQPATPLLAPTRFIVPFLTHAMGTLAGVLAAYCIASSRKAPFARAIGALFLCSDTVAAVMIPASRGWRPAICCSPTCRWHGWRRGSERGGGARVRAMANGGAC